MPRKRKPVQSTAPVPGQAYGNGIDQQQAMAAVPLPDVQQARVNATTQGMQNTGAPTPGPIPGQGAPPPSAAGGAPGGFEAALAAARQMTPPTGMLNQVLTNPDAGRMSGPPPQNAVWTQLAELTGDPYYLRLAQRARLAQ